MNLFAGIGLVAVGILIILAGVLKVAPGAVGSGIWAILAGIVVIGLSFVKGPDPEGAPREATAGTLTGVFFSPGETFRSLRRHPRWLVAVLVMTIASTIFTSLFFYRLTPERITNFTLDKTLESSFVASNEEAKRQIELQRPEAIAIAKNPVTRAAGAVGLFSQYTIAIAILGAVFFLFIMIMGGKINFMQAFAATAYAWFPVSIIRSVLSSIIVFIKDPNQIHPLLGQQGGLISDNLSFLVTPSQSPVLYTFLGGLGLISFYWLWLNATGLKETGERVTNGSAWISTVAVWIVGLLLGISMAFLFPSFMS